jgi:hypothetical protein
LLISDTTDPVNSGEPNEASIGKGKENNNWGWDWLFAMSKTKKCEKNR